MIVRPRYPKRELLLTGLAIALPFAGGCASSGLDRARQQFHDGTFTNAAHTLSVKEPKPHDKVLVLMERGTAWQSAGEHNNAIKDWIEAVETIRQLDYIRVSEKASSLVINDNTQTYVGRPYERILLHAFTAKSFFALGEWHSAAVEARLITDVMEDLNGFPDDPYARYLAATAFELIRDFNSSRIEFTKANEILPALHIDPISGCITTGTNAPPPSQPQKHELICFIGIGRAPEFTMPSHVQNLRWGANPYVEIRSGNHTLGRSYTLAATTRLAAATEARQAILQAVKTVTRILVKESIASTVEDDNAILGGILRILLFAMEVPDTRSWQTLPNWLQVARVPLPENSGSIELLFKTSSGATIKRIYLPDNLPTTDGKTIFSTRAW